MIIFSCKQMINRFNNWHSKSFKEVFSLRIFFFTESMAYFTYNLNIHWSNCINLRGWANFQNFQAHSPYILNIWFKSLLCSLDCTTNATHSSISHDWSRFIIDNNLRKFWDDNWKICSNFLFLHIIEENVNCNKCFLCDFAGHIIDMVHHWWDDSCMEVNNIWYQVLGEVAQSIDSSTSYFWSWIVQAFRN